MMASVSPWNIASASMVALLREPGGCPAGFPLSPFSNFILFSPGYASKAAPGGDRGHEKTPARFPARGTVREFQFDEQTDWKWVSSRRDACHRTNRPRKTVTVGPTVQHDLCLLRRNALGVSAVVVFPPPRTID
jgi:hypothetical protein